MPVSLCPTVLLLSLLRLPLYCYHLNSNCRTIRTLGDLITARAKAPASSNGAAEHVPRAKSFFFQLIMPLFYYSRLTEEAGAHLTSKTQRVKRRDPP